MNHSRQPSQEERTITDKANTFSGLIFEWMWALLYPAAYWLIIMAFFCILMIIINVITNEPKYIIYITYVWPFMIFIFSFLWIVTLSTIFISTYFIKILIKTSSDFEASKKNIESLEMILNHTQSILQLIWKIHHVNQLLHFFANKKIITKMNHFLKDYTDNIVGFLWNLRSDLIYRLEEQQQILTSAQYEFDHHISGTTELDQVATLQRQRLDEQIRQFEELQRVLV
jgi:hypothetical protein